MSLNISNTWKCLACSEEPEFEHKDMMQHFRDVHKIEPKTTKGKKSMLMHLDAADSYTFQWEWTIGDIKAIQCVTNKREEGYRFT